MATKKQKHFTWSNYWCQTYFCASGWVGLGHWQFKIGDSYRISELCELVIFKHISILNSLKEFVCVLIWWIYLSWVLDCVCLFVDMMDIFILGGLAGIYDFLGSKLLSLWQVTQQMLLAPSTHNNTNNTNTNANTTNTNTNRWCWRCEMSNSKCCLHQEIRCKVPE